MVVGSSRAAAQGNWLGSAQVTMYLGRYPGWRCAAAGGLLAAGRGQVGHQPMETGGRKRWTGTAGSSQRETGTSGHLDIWCVGQTPGTGTPGTLGTSQLGQSQGCGTNGRLEGPAARTLEACFHSPVEHGHSAGWAALPRPSEVPSFAPLCWEVHVREPGDERTGGLAWGLPAWASFCRPHGI